MESGKILDRQITASSEWDDHWNVLCAAHQGRLNFQEVVEGGVARKSGSWTADKDDKNQWLQVDLLRQESVVTRGWQRGDRDPVSRTNFNKIHASRFESVIVGETSGKRNFHNQTQIIHESRIPHERDA